MKWKYFKKEEFKCYCCGENRISEQFIDFLNAARDRAGTPFVVNSGYRCQEHNSMVGGKKDSAHLKGLAADIRCTSSKQRFFILSGLLGVGFSRIGIYKDFIHVDCDNSKPLNAVFLP